MDVFRAFPVFLHVLVQRFPQGFDPCCGKGTALSALGADADCMTYGVEIDEGRAESALSRLTRVGFGSYFYSRISRQAFHAMLLNPPYMPITAIWLKRSYSFP